MVSKAIRVKRGEQEPTMFLRSLADIHWNALQRVPYLYESIISFSAAFNESPIQESQSKTNRRCAHALEAAQARRCGAAVARRPSPWLDPARTASSALPPRAKWRPNWDITLEGKSLHNLLDPSQI